MGAREVEARVRRKIRQRMDFAMREVVKDVKDSMKTSAYVGRGPRGGRIIEPSAPGEPPRVRSRRLISSIDHAVEVTPEFVVGVVGTNVEYSRALEWGFIPSNLKPRPYLRPAARRKLKRVYQILLEGKREP